MNVTIFMRDYEKRAVHSSDLTLTIREAVFHIARREPGFFFVRAYLRFLDRRPSHVVFTTCEPGSAFPKTVNNDNTESAILQDYPLSNSSLQTAGPDEGNFINIDDRRFKIH